MDGPLSCTQQFLIGEGHGSAPQPPLSLLEQKSVATDVIYFTAPLKPYGRCINRPVTWILSTFLGISSSQKTDTPFHSDIPVHYGQHERGNERMDRHQTGGNGNDASVSSDHHDALASRNVAAVAEWKYVFVLICRLKVKIYVGRRSSRYKTVLATETTPHSSRFRGIGFLC
ncbi:hypothetical protein TNCV_4462461 [Trichonephila clavipes]|nr:hypothetical protein TNCV_4462461 [Trichonephila clavipes]